MKYKKVKSEFSKNKKRINLVTIMIILIFIVAILLSIGTSFNDHTYTITVTDKERVNKEDDSKYLVFADDINTGDSLVFENTDTMVRFKWNSSNLQSKLHIGKTYKVTVIGFRFPITDMYENILKVKEYEDEVTNN